MFFNVFAQIIFSMELTSLLLVIHENIFIYAIHLMNSQPIHLNCICYEPMELHIHNVMFGIDFMRPCPKKDYELLMLTLHVKTIIVDFTYGSYTCALVIVQL
jgi:hypothetical protein